MALAAPDPAASAAKPCLYTQKAADYVKSSSRHSEAEGSSRSGQASKDGVTSGRPHSLGLPLFGIRSNEFFRKRPCGRRDDSLLNAP